MQKKKPGKVTIGLSVLVLALILWLSTKPTVDYYFRSHDDIFTVTKVDAPVTCHSLRRKWVGPKFRSSAPEIDVIHFYGGIFTDVGVYRLPPSNRFLMPNEPREELIGELKAGCTYRARIVGSGEPFKIKLADGAKIRLPVTQKIVKIYEKLGCE